MSYGKIDLHLHLDGSLSLEVVKKLSELIGFEYQGNDIKKLLTVGGECASLMDYLQCFQLPSMLLQTPKALELAAFDLVSRLAGQGLYYAEIRFAPQLHIQKGMDGQQAVEAVVKGISRGCKDTGFRANALLCAMVNGNDKDNQETIELARAYLGKGVAGADLAGPEGAVDMDHFKGLFKMAYSMDVPFTIHAGECGSYEHVAQAVSYGARRIGHGCGAVYSDACMKLLSSEKITLEMCVTSNLQTKAVPGLKEHPIRKFYDRGIRVTFNTDNMTVSDTTLEEEARLLTEFLGFSETDITKLERFAAEAAFVSDSERAELLSLLS